ncbi:MAG: hypothetical protein ACK5MD_02135 [Flavobacteriales bacterium]
MKNLKTVTVMVFMLIGLITSAQELKYSLTNEVDVNNLPEYIVITSENTKILGGINIIIDAKRSIYEDRLLTLENLLQSGKKMRIRNQTDLLNVFSQIGYEFIDAYNATSGSLGLGGEVMILRFREVQQNSEPI